MLWKVAWRNIWRNRTRSLVIIIAIALGLWAGVFASAFVVGMMHEKIDSLIKLEISDFQVHHPKFRDEQDVRFFIAEPEKLIEGIRREEGVRGVSERLVVNAMISGPGQSGAAQVFGVDPEREAVVSGLNTYIDSGAWFEGIKRNPIVLSHRLAEKYHVKLRSKLVITVQDVHGEITAASFRVAGIFDTKNPPFDDRQVYVRRSDLDALLGSEGKVHEIAVSLDDHEQADPMASKFAAVRSDLEILPWMDLTPGMRLMIGMLDTYTYYIVGIIMLALLFSIINTMLMAVLERVREIGMLMAVGMNKMRVFSMIVLETIMLTMIGGPVGLILAWGSVNYFGKVGINVGGSAYADMGFAATVYTRLVPQTYLIITLMVIGMAILAAIYPARKALQLNPSEAIRKI
ncbi:MAG: ABC transporter permease [Flavobacteriales bacterium]|nr:ABC transporter permease [Flavobacteriales bacterium]